LAVKFGVYLLQLSVVQRDLFKMTLYDSVYLYLKLSSEVLSRGGDKSTITNGAFMYNQAKNYYAETSK